MKWLSKTPLPYWISTSLFFFHFILLSYIWHKSFCYLSANLYYVAGPRNLRILPKGRKLLWQNSRSSMRILLQVSAILRMKLDDQLLKVEIYPSFTQWKILFWGNHSLDVALLLHNKGVLGPFRTITFEAHVLYCLCNRVLIFVIWWLPFRFVRNKDSFACDFLFTLIQ